MQRNEKWLSDAPGAGIGRTVLCVDPDETYARMLHDAWMKLQFADDLHIVRSPAEAVAFISSDAVQLGLVPLAAVILDPAAIGEETGAFVRAMRKYCGKDSVPLVFWSQDSEKYEVLEGRGVELVLKKPMVLRLIHALDRACQLSVKHFKPFAGNRMYAHPPAGMLTGATPSLW